MLSFTIVGFFGAISALVPDLDHDSSKCKRILDMMFISVAFFMIYFSKCGKNICFPSIDTIGQMAILFFAFLGIYFLFFRFFKPKHRGITHTIVAGVVFGVLVYLFAGWALALAGVVGYASHLLADNHVKMI